MTRCPACGREGCPSASDPPTGPFTLHNAAAHAAELERRRQRAAAVVVHVREDDHADLALCGEPYAPTPDGAQAYTLCEACRLAALR